MIYRVALVAAVATVLAQPATAAQRPTSGRLFVFGSPQQVITLAPAEDGNGRVGRLRLLVRNESDVPVSPRIRFVRDSGGVPTRLRPPTREPFPADKPALYTNDSDLSTGRLVMRPRQTLLIALSFGVAEDAEAGVVNGTLIVAPHRNRRVQSAAVRISEQPPTAAALPPAQPQKVTLRVRRWFPGGVAESWRRVVEPTVWVPGAKSESLALLSSGSGHSMKVRLTEPETDSLVPAGAVQQRVVVAAVGAVGTYAGELTLKQGGEEKITVEGKVGDFIGWPLVVVAIGALLGGYGVRRFERWRTRRILKAELGRSLRDYRNRADTSKIGALNGVVSEDAISALESDVLSAQTTDELDEVTARIRGVRDSVRDWIGIDDAARSLITKQLPGDPESNVRMDALAALDATKWVPSDHDEADELATRLRREERILEAFDEAYARWPDAANLVYENLRTGDDDKIASTDDKLTAALIGALGRVEREPVFPTEFTDEEREEATKRIVAITTGVQLSTFERMVGVREDLGVLRFGRSADGGPPTTRVRLSPEQLIRPIRRWDRALALVTFAVTVLVFVLTLYDDDFGTWEDYAKAFTAGLAGQVGGAALWSLFPSLRSYRLPVAKPAK